MEVLAGRSLSEVLPRYRARAPSTQEGAAIQDLAFGVLRYLGLLRAALAVLVHRPLGDADLEALLLVAVYQLEFTRMPAHVVVHEAVDACGALRKTSARGLVNAVLRSYLRQPKAVLSRARRSETGRWSYPQWWIDTLKAAYPGRFAEILESGNSRPPMTLRVNRRKSSVEAYLLLLEREAIAAVKIDSDAVLLDRPLAIERLPGFADGLVSVQDLSAQFAARYLDLHAGQRVLDACSAPGGKAAHIAELEDVALTAIDFDADRLERVARTFGRLELQPPRLIAADATALDEWWDGRPFDRILLDAPCTASGIVRRHPDIKWLRRPTDIATLAAQQQALLSALWRTLAPGGKLLFATCSVFPEETWLQPLAFLQRHGDARRMELSGIPGNGNIEGQIFPDARHDGFYYALLEKI
jgi:16S rRNA (cytosine967-C5)-methyltransferase